MSTERERLAVYDCLRTMHAILKDIPQREDDWEQNALDAVHSVLYLAEHVFSHDPEESQRSGIIWKRAKFAAVTPSRKK